MKCCKPELRMDPDERRVWTWHTYRARHIASYTETDIKAYWDKCCTAVAEPADARKCQAGRPHACPMHPVVSAPDPYDFDLDFDVPNLASMQDEVEDECTLTHTHSMPYPVFNPADTWADECTDDYDDVTFENERSLVEAETD